MPQSLLLYVGGACVIVCALIGGGAALAVKWLAKGKRLAGLASNGDGSDVENLKSVLKSRATNMCPPAVRIQVIYNWINQFMAAHVDTPKNRLNRLTSRLEELQRARLRADVAMQFEMAELIKAKKILLEWGVGLVSVATQKKSPNTDEENKPKHRVRFLTPTPRHKRTTEQLFTRILKLLSNAYVTLKCIGSVVKYLIDFLEKQSVLQTLHTMSCIIVAWSGKLLNIDVKADLKKKETTLGIVLYPANRHVQ